jgi:hypothetical protein
MRDSRRRQLERAEPNLEVALAVKLPSLDDLLAAVSSDVDPVVHGIAWWSPHLGTVRRILVSDYLIESLYGIRTNLKEARLHLWEVEDQLELESERFAEAVDRRTFPRINVPVSANALDEVPKALVELHTAGVVRALSSAIDCMAVSVVGVTGLDRPIVRTAWHDTITFLAGRKRHAEHQALAARIMQAKQDAGPAGWLEWTIATRNTLVHRSRRLSSFMLSPRVSTPLLGPDGVPIIRSRVDQVLNREPHWTDIEALVVEAGTPASDRLGAPSPVTMLLTEASLTTLSGAVESAVAFLEAVCAELRVFWERRKSAPTLIPQPASQWPNIEVQDPLGFDGYAPGTHGFHSGSGITASERVGRRMTASALFDDQRHDWATFDD